MGIVQRIVAVLLLALLPLAGGAQPVVTLEVIDNAASEAGPDTASFRITRSGGDNTNALRVRVPFGTGTAADSDWVSDPIELRFSSTQGYDIPAGEDELIVTVTPTADNLFENDETLDFSIAPDPGGSPAYVVGAPNRAQMTITDDPAVITIEAVDEQASEFGPDTATFRIGRSGGDLSSTLRVRVPALSGTAALSDWDSDPPVLFFSSTQGYDIPADAEELLVTVTPTTDTLAEGDETIDLAIAPDPGAVPAYSIGSPNRALITISDDAAFVTLIALDTDLSELGPDTGRFEIRRSGGDLSQPLLVRTPIGGTAERNDYTSDPPVIFTNSTQNYEIEANQTSLVVEITPIFDDRTDEADETLTFTLEADATYNIGTPDFVSMLIENVTFEIFRDSFETQNGAAGKLDTCHIGTAAKADPARFLDAGVTILDLETDLTWLRCAVTEWFDWVNSACLASEPGGLPVNLKLLNAGVIGDNGGFDDWRLPTKRELAAAGTAARGCLVRD